jgi:hypothetical protein
MIEPIVALVTQVLLITFKFSAIVDFHNLQFTVTHALGSSAFTSRLLATELEQSHYD